jgi:ABC-2 type transport system ATP-binding protein
MAEVLHTQGLTKIYKEIPALDSLSISLEEGHIYGLIGPDGAGKTTLLRLLAGLCFPTTGNFSLFGSQTAAQLRNARKRIGFLIETPIAVEYFSLRQNLELQALMTVRKDKEGLKELRRRLGLTERAVGHRRFKDCAVWERQRYGLAAALLGDPELLLLDEPLNGLDPEGIREARTLLGELNREKGVTMLIATPFPAELRGLATDYIFLDEGRLLRTLRAEELEQMQSEDPDQLASELLRLREEGERNVS